VLIIHKVTTILPLKRQAHDVAIALSTRSTAETRIIVHAARMACKNAKKITEFALY
jgi:hypothetical protein